MKRFRSGLKLDVFSIAILALAVGVFFYPVFRGEVLFFGDNLSLKLPNAIYAASRLKQGALPLWNPYLFAGLPFLADISTSVFYPLSMLFLVFDPFWALTAQVILSVFLAGMFCFFLARAWDMSRQASVLCAIAFMFGATVIHYTTYLPLLSSSIWLPLTFWLFHQALANGSRRWVVLASVSLGLQIIGGHPQPVFYTVLLMICYGMFFPFGKSLLKRLAVLAVIVGLALALTAVVVLPALQLMRLSTRSVMDFASATADSLHPLLLLRLLLPNLFDNPKVGMTWGPAWRHVADNTGYIGILVLFLVCLVLMRILHGERVSARRPCIFFLGTSIVSLIIALGRYTPLYRIIFELVPIFRIFRGPAEAWLTFTFSMAVVGGYAFDEVKKRGMSIVTARRFLLVAGVMWMVGVGLFVVSRFAFSWVWRPFSTFHTLERDQVIVGMLSANVVLVGFLLGLGIIFLCWKKYWFFVALVFFDLLFSNSRYVFTLPRKLVHFESDQAKQLLQILTSSERFLSYQDYQLFTGLGNYWENMTLRPPFAETFYTLGEQRTYRELNRRLSDLALDWNMIYGLPTPNGYASFVLVDYLRYLQAEKGFSLRLNEVGLREVEAEKLDQLSVAYFLTEQGIVRNSRALPRVRVVDHSGESAGEAEIMINDPERVVVAADAEREGLLVLADSFYPGWQAVVDGERAGIGHYQGVFRSVRMPEGEHVVEFVFRPQLVYLGAAILGLTVTVCLLFIWKEKRMRGKLV